MFYADGIRLSAGGITKFFSSWIIRQHVIDSLRYQLKHFCEPNPREAYYGKKREKSRRKEEEIIYISSAENSRLL